jgi:phenylpropionate dioxygenase-like ring-hydroxylating dioxygenase large terminal subunit
LPHVGLRRAGPRANFAASRFRVIGEAGRPAPSPSRTPKHCEERIFMSQVVDNFAVLQTALDRGESLPARWYTDASITSAEIGQIFRKAWNYIGPLDRLRNLGDYLTGSAGAVPVVVIRNAAGFAGFVNVWRDRRHEVMKGHPNAKVMQCGYHAWTYDLAGRLKGAPRSAGEPNFRLEDFPLLPTRAEALGPFVFVNLDPDAAPLAAYYGPVLDIIKGSGVDLDTLELHDREDWRSHSNWKTMLENYLECYHCPVAHPGFSAAVDVRRESYELAAHGWFLSQIGRVRPSVRDGRNRVRIYDSISRNWLSRRSQAARRQWSPARQQPRRFDPDRDTAPGSARHFVA